MDSITGEIIDSLLQISTFPITFIAITKSHFVVCSGDGLIKWIEMEEHGTSAEIQLLKNETSGKLYGTKITKPGDEQGVEISCGSVAPSFEKLIVCSEEGL